MRRTALRALSVVGAWAIGGHASAADAWRAVTLDGGVRIDIPAAVANRHLPAPDLQAKGEIMFFLVGSNDTDELGCALHRYIYGQGLLTNVSRAETIERLASADRAALCGGDAKDALVERSQYTTSPEGYPAGLCAAAYSVFSDAKTPGRVKSVDAIAAPNALYELSCTVHGVGMIEADDAWKESWSARIKHIENSLRLP